MNSASKTNTKLVLSALVVVVLGVVSGWFLYSRVINKNATTQAVAAPGAVVTKDEAGVLDESVQYDNAVGMLVEGGTGNEGTHHITREGGESKNVYLTSSVIDLQSFVGKKVEVWGQTLASKKAGWLMDVAKIKIVE